MNKNTVKNKLFDYASIVSFSVITTFIFSPFVVYVTNIDEFWFRMSAFMPMLCLCALAVIFVTVLCLMVMPRKSAGFLATIIFALGACIYIQGQVLKNDYGVLDGHEIHWEQNSLKTVGNILFWVAVITIVIFLYTRFFEKAISVLRIVAFVWIVYEILISGLLFVQHRGQIFSYRKDEEMHITDEGLLDISSSHNVIVILLDEFDSDTFLEMEKQYPEVDGIFDGFRYYPDTVGATGRTIYAIPYILTGGLYTQNTTHDAFMEESYKNSPLMKRLENNDVKAVIYTADYYVDKSAKSSIDNLKVTKGAVTSYIGLTKDVLKLTCFRCFPRVLKRYVWIYSGEFDKYQRSDDYTLQTENNVKFFDDLKEKKLNIAYDDKCFKFIHIEGNHEPYVIDETGYYGESSRIKQARGCMNYLEEYFKQLKELGVYEESYIVVMSDHGRGIDETSMTSTLANPILFVKPSGSMGKMQISDKSMHYSCLMTMFCDAVDGCDKFPDEYIETPDVRYYYHGLETAVGVEEYVINGVAYDNPEVIFTGKTFKGNLLQDGEYPKYRYGKQLSFGKKQTGYKYAVEGIRYPEEEYSVLMTYQTVFRFKVKEGPDRIRVTMDAYPRNGKQNIRITANGYEVYKDVYTPGNLIAEIPMEYVPDGNLELIIEHKDQFDYGVALVSMVIEPVK